MYSLKTESSFDSAHFLSGYDGKCANIHGHRWKVVVEVKGEKLTASGDKRGMLIDFGDLKSAVRSLADHYDHALIFEKGTLKPATLAALNDEGFRLIEIECRPTAENFARLFFEQLITKGLAVSKVTVYETPENCASYEV